MEKEKIFIDGMLFKAPNETTKEKAPWIKGHISVKVPDFVNFLQKHNTNSGWVNIDLKKSKEKGTLYLELNTYIKKEKVEDLDLDEEKNPQEIDEERPNETVYDEEGNSFNPDEIPF